MLPDFPAYLPWRILKSVLKFRWKQKPEVQEELQGNLRSRWRKRLWLQGDGSQQSLEKSLQKWGVWWLRQMLQIQHLCFPRFLMLQKKRLPKGQCWRCCCYKKCIYEFVLVLKKTPNPDGPFVFLVPQKTHPQFVYRKESAFRSRKNHGQQDKSTGYWN